MLPTGGAHGAGPPPKKELNNGAGPPPKRELNNVLPTCATRDDDVDPTESWERAGDDAAAFDEDAPPSEVAERGGEDPRAPALADPWSPPVEAWRFLACGWKKIVAASCALPTAGLALFCSRAGNP